MKSVMRVIQFDDYGPPERLLTALRDVPRPAPGEVRIRVLAAGVNPADAKWRSGMFRERIPLQLPHVPGYDISGVVDAVGEGVWEFAPGQRVVTMLDSRKMGGYAEYAVASVEVVSLLPERLDHSVAASLPTPALTGFQMIGERICPARGETVLVTGALGAVGRSALFAARALGAKVIAAVRPEQKADAVSLGAADAIGLGQDAWTGAPFDHVADTVGGSEVAALCRHLRPGGRIRTAATTPISGHELSVDPVFLSVRPDKVCLDRILAHVADGDFSIPIAYTLSFPEAARAHHHVEAGGVGGKIILSLESA